MDEKILAELTVVLKDLREKLGTSSFSLIRGPVGDPGPEMGWHTPSLTRLGNFRGPISDPAPWHLLDKSRIAKLKIRQLDMAIKELNQQIDLLKLEQSLLKEEYKTK